MQFPNNLASLHQKFISASLFNNFFFRLFAHVCLPLRPSSVTGRTLTSHHQQISLCQVETPRLWPCQEQNVKSSEVHSVRWLVGPSAFSGSSWQLLDGSAQTFVVAEGWILPALIIVWLSLQRQHKVVISAFERKYVVSATIGLGAEESDVGGFHWKKFVDSLTLHYSFSYTLTLLCAIHSWLES